jgi:hypothetical protein
MNRYEQLIPLDDDATKEELDLLADEVDAIISLSETDEY